MQKVDSQLLVFGITERMTVADLYMGLGSLVYALAKADGLLKAREVSLIRELLRREPNGDVALCSFTVREHYGDTVEEAYQFAMRCFRAYPAGLTEERLQRFSRILEAVARIDGTICEAEHTVLARFREDTQLVGSA